MPVTVSGPVVVGLNGIVIISYGMWTNLHKIKKNALRALPSAATQGRVYTQTNTHKT
jgi:hypothetical protein